MYYPPLDPKLRKIVVARDFRRRENMVGVNMILAEYYQNTFK